jgi:signal peptidase I
MIREAHLEAACCDLVAEVVRGAGSANLKVTGLSMFPAIWPGDVLTVRSQSPDLLEPGQIILYRRNGKLTAHRVIRVSGDELITQGDCVPSFDQPVHASEVVGQVAGICRNSRMVKLQQSLGQRAAAWVLRRSAWCTRILLHLHAAVQRFTAVPE